MYFKAFISQWLRCVGGCSILLTLAGCSVFPESAPQQNAPAALNKFYSAGTVQHVLDKELIYQSLKTRAEYRLHRGDLLELHLPATVNVITDDLAETGKIEQTHTLLCRVNEDGAITLPIVDDVTVVDQTLTEAEKTIQQAYCPKYIVSPPVIVTRIIDYKKYYVSVTGAVEKPGAYLLRSDQMTLVGLLMEAGGIEETGAAVIRVSNPNRPAAPPAEPNPQEAAPETVGRENTAGKLIVMPIRGLNIPFSDMVLEEGDMVEVQGISEQVFTVMGLVNRQGSYVYPADAQYNLPQALAFAGGVIEKADPHYVHVYRPLPDGEVVDASFSIRPGEDFREIMSVAIRPGDVIAVEHTARTRSNLFLADIFQLRATVGMIYDK